MTTPWHPDWVSDATPFCAKIAPLAFPILIQRAREGRPITYGDLAAEIERRFGVKQQPRKDRYGAVVGLIGHQLESLGEAWGDVLPPLNTIVINKAHKCAGDGGDPLLIHYLHAKGQIFYKRRRKDHHADAREMVFNYGARWKTVAEAFGAPILKPAFGQAGSLKALKLPKAVHGGGDETPEHKNLKKWVREHPTFVQAFGRFEPGEPEYELSSGDKLDVHFGTLARRLAVEVKPSHASINEFRRGVFQVVKYRAVMRAEQTAKELIPQAEAVLVTTTSPDPDSRELMRRLGVVHLLAPKHAED